ncbi:MFS transporter [Nonomuraea sp. NPDC052265]|uniref:MFS transporter n=1 Tax=Nonomuraea sp. NPDC052265 TaxID=3364374 RepID=UPI0037C50654
MSTTRSPARIRRPGWSLALLALGHLIISLDFTIIYVALPDIATHVGFTPHTLQWVVTAYAVLYGGFLLFGGRLSDLAGRRRMFVLTQALGWQAVFLRVQARGRTPLMPLRLFRNRALSGAVVVILVFGLTTQAVPYFLTLYFRGVLGFSALETGWRSSARPCRSRSATSSASGWSTASAP